MRSTTWREERDRRGRSLVMAHQAEATTGERLVALLVAGDAVRSIRFRRKLQLDGYAVATAIGLDHALEMAAVLDPDIIFVSLDDWEVPALVLLTLRTDPATAGVPTVLITDRPAGDLAREVGGLHPGEQVLRRRLSQIHSEPPPLSWLRHRTPARGSHCCGRRR
jgi:PleD family two-component response regulator